MNFYGAYTTPKVAAHILETTIKQKWTKFNKMKQIRIPCRIFFKERTHMRNKMNTNRHQISFWLKISVQYSVVTSLLVFTWIKTKWISKRYEFHIGNFDKNEISFWVIKYHVNTTQNEYLDMSIHISLFWNAAEMKRYLKRTCFHGGLKSHVGLSSFRLSC